MNHFCLKICQKAYTTVNERLAFVIEVLLEDPRVHDKDISSLLNTEGNHQMHNISALKRESPKSKTIKKSKIRRPYD